MIAESQWWRHQMDKYYVAIKVWGGITYPFPNLNGAIVEV